eukprot:15110200-Alexandrium_andersonii.AAC.1
MQAARGAFQGGRPRQDANWEVARLAEPRKPTRGLADVLRQPPNWHVREGKAPQDRPKEVFD